MDGGIRRCSTIWVGLVFIALWMQYFCYAHGLHNRARLQGKILLRESLKRSELKAGTGSKVKTQAKFVETLLNGILQMLLSNPSGLSPQGLQGLVGSAQNANNMIPSSSGPPEEGIETEEEVPPPEAPYAPPVAAGTTAKAASPEASIGTALNVQQNQMAVLNQQIASLGKEVKRWQDMETEILGEGKGGEGGMEGNQIQLSIRYPGKAAKEPTPSQLELEKKKKEAEQAEKEEMMLLAGANAISAEKAIDPSTLRVPVFVLAPKAETDYHNILLQTVRDAAKKGKGASVVAETQSQLEASPVERAKLHRQQLKLAEAHEEFFTNDLAITNARVRGIKGKNNLKVEEK